MPLGSKNNQGRSVDCSSFFVVVVVVVVVACFVLFFAFCLFLATTGHHTGDQACSV